MKFNCMPFTDARLQVNFIESLVMKSFLERYGFLPKAWTRYLTLWVPLNLDPRF